MDKFFRPQRIYAVAGASTNTEKFGHKVFKWYVDRKLPVTPINPKRETILGMNSVASINDVETPATATDGIGLSVVTPPAVTNEMIKSLSKGDNKIQAIWLQPGTWNQETLDLAQASIPTVITNCVLVNGDKYLSKL